MADAWHDSRGGQQAGPVSGDQLRQWPAAGELSAQDLVWREGMAKWLPIELADGGIR